MPGGGVTIRSAAAKCESTSLGSRQGIPRAARFHAARAVLILLVVGLLTPMLRAATFTVTNTLDSGAGSFRQAILDANATAGSDTIAFQIPGPGPFTISPTTALPPLTEPVVVDGTTQPGYTVRPVIELNGTGAGGGVVGLRVAGGSSLIRGLAINRFDSDGIRLDSGGNAIQGNYIGTDVTGTLARGNGQYGIFVFGTAANLLGGTNTNERNLIAGGNDTGIYVLNATASGNVIQGNYIGVNEAGTAALGNMNNGIAIYNAPGNTIGGSLPGARNVISGNQGSGLNLNLAGANGNVVQGNYIGVNASGLGSLSNRADGITLNNAPGNLLGGTNAGAGNLISGNGQSGVFLNGAGARDNLVAGNWIGTDASGVTALGNGYAGVTLSAAVSNQIGLATSLGRNVISGNQQDGIYLAANSRNIRIQGNFIGTTVGGSNALGNLTTGITLNNASYNLLGGAAAGNVIAGNVSIGIWLRNAGSSNNTVAGNLIGVGVGGANALGNNGGGIGVSDAPNNQFGGPAGGEGNVISGNGFPANQGGVFVTGSSATGNRFEGNLIGTDSTGQVALANRYEGFYLIGSRSNVIGGDLPGAGNLISGNTTRGIRITNSWGNDIRGNRLGTRADGVTALANGQFNVELEAGSSSNNIGGLTPAAGNQIAYTGNYSGGPFAGVRVRDFATNNAILGNTIFANSGLGIAFSGLTATPNDNCDVDTGGNNRQNFPVLTQAYGGATAGVRGSLNSKANTVFRLQFFASPGCDGSGNGEGQIYLGDTLVTTDGTCNNGFVVTLPAPVTPGFVITATATDPANNTSEFSACQSVLSAPQLNLLLPGASQVALTWTNIAPGFGLQQTTNLTPPVTWTPVTNVPVISAGQFVVTLARPADNRFYRLNFE
jgi:titin